MALSLQQEFALLPVEQQQLLLSGMSDEKLLEIYRGEWWWTSRPEQVPPSGDWNIFLFLAGRGSGKSRSGSEWIVERCELYPKRKAGTPTEHLIVAQSIDDARTTCIEGESGVLFVLERKGYVQGKDFSYTSSPKPKIVFKKTGTKIFTAGADRPDVGRGRNLTSLLLDELVAWRTDADKLWSEGLMPSLRADIEGDHPRCYVTTTPKPIPLLREWLARQDGSVAISRGSTFDNVVNLSEHALGELRRRYEGTSIGRQELYGEMLDLAEGALFSYADIAACRVNIGPEVVKARVCAVDPSLLGSEDGDEMGVIVASRDERNHMYVIADESAKLAGREAALHCWRVFDTYACDVLVIETNLGKAWMLEVMIDAFRELQKEGVFPEGNYAPPIKTVHGGSNSGKQLRAEPVSMRHQQRTIHMVGEFPLLEGQMVSWDPLLSRDSPDRLDAFVYACRWLMEGEARKAKIHSPTQYTVEALQSIPSSRMPMGRRAGAVARRLGPNG